MADRLSAAQLESDLIAQLSAIADEFPGAALASSLAAEDMVLTDAILKNGLNLSIFTLETGRLHPETLGMIQRVSDHYGYTLEVYRPDPAAVEAYVKDHGLNAFYESVELRKACCGMRKVEPLRRALSTRPAWMTGQRRAQSTTRTTLAFREEDAAHGIPKFNPLTDWSEDDVWNYIRTHQVPYNPLHDRGYPSIGCDPCTRAVRPGEDIRAGRWWWESSDSKECGLHVSAPASPLRFQPKLESHT